MTASVVFRPAGPEDLATTYDVFLAAANDLRARSQRPPVDDTPQRRARAMPFRRHALAHDPERFWVAEDAGRIVGFGVATLRQRLWYLAALHVVPPYQGQGLGRELLRRCLAAGGGAGVVRIVISESAQPVSNALYAKHGMYQWAPLLHVEGSLPAQVDASRRAGAHEGSRGDEREDRRLAWETVAAGSPALPTLDAIDSAVLGVVRTVDHRHWLAQPDLACLLFRRQGDAVGYAYVSASGQVGPIAVRVPRDLPQVLAASLRTAAAHGAAHASLVVPGHSRSALSYLLANGLRYGESINLLLASRPFGHMDRYLVSAGDALF